jgi:hypothetical protein
MNCDALTFCLELCKFGLRLRACVFVRVCVETITLSFLQKLLPATDGLSIRHKNVFYNLSGG